MKIYAEVSTILKFNYSLILETFSIMSPYLQLTNLLWLNKSWIMFRFFLTILNSLFSISCYSFLPKYWHMRKTSPPLIWIPFFLLCILMIQYLQYCKLMMQFLEKLSYKYGDIQFLVGQISSHWKLTCYHVVVFWLAFCNQSSVA